MICQSAACHEERPGGVGGWRAVRLCHCGGCGGSARAYGCSSARRRHSHSRPGQFGTTTGHPVQAGYANARRATTIPHAFPYRFLRYSVDRRKGSYSKLNSRALDVRISISGASVVLARRLNRQLKGGDAGHCVYCTCPRLAVDGEGAHEFQRRSVSNE